MTRAIALTALLFAAAPLHAQTVSHPGGQEQLPKTDRLGGQEQFPKPDRLGGQEQFP